MHYHPELPILTLTHNSVPLWGRQVDDCLVMFARGLRHYNVWFVLQLVISLIKPVVIRLAKLAGDVLVPLVTWYIC